jgi:hypothetical protein
MSVGAESPSQRLRRVGRDLGVSRAIKSLVRKAGFDLLGRHYYSPIPDVSALPATVWTRRSDLRAVRFDVAAALDFARRELSAYIAEYEPPRHSTGRPRDFYLANEYYEGVDAEILYAMVRRFSPHRVIELGSGMSTLVIADAVTRGGGGTRHSVYDPYPRRDLNDTLGQVADLHYISATDVPLSVFDELSSGDFLFVDTSHTVKVGGEVNRIMLDVLPRLAPGVIVHIHDIYLPWEYPRDFLTERSFFWAEQYLLQAFLAFNAGFEVLLPVHALWRDFPADIAEIIPSARTGARPSALWMRRTYRQ